MNHVLKCTFLLAAAAAVAPAPGASQGRPAGMSAAAASPEARLAAEREAMARLSYMDGVWRGRGWTITPAGRHEVTQTERIGPFLGGSVRMIEGRGYDSKGSVAFNALGVISFDPATGRYSIASWAQGYSGTFPLRPTADGYIWEVPAGPGAITRYTATIGNGRWREIGERIVGDAPPVQVFEMNLKRVSSTDWPTGKPVPMR
jgi:hypothetical protein